MKPKNFVLRFIVTVIVGFLVWWFLRPMPKAPEKTASAPEVSKIEAPKQIAPPTQIAQLLAAPAKSKSETTSSPSPSIDASSDSSDPQTNLKTAVLDMARLYRAGDKATFFQTYTPPDKLDSQQIEQIRERDQQIATNPQLQLAIQKMNDAVAKAWEDLENQTPTYNDVGDEATYTWSVDLSGNGDPFTEQRTFIKINGKWYLKANDISN